MQYLPKDGLYVYFRYDETSTVMVVLNASSKPNTLEWKQYAERTNGFKQAYDVITGEILADKKVLNPMESRVVLLSK